MFVMYKTESTYGMKITQKSLPKEYVVELNFATKISFV